VKRPFPFHPNYGRTLAHLIGLALFFLLFILGCRGGGEETPPVDAAQQQGALSCNDECADRGQCGKTVNGNNPVILGHTDRPAVQDHQITFPADTSLPILTTQDELVQVVATGEQFYHTFFLIRRADERVGWVAGWCINPQ
jgi:hypothetical protein